MLYKHYLFTALLFCCFVHSAFSQKVNTVAATPPHLQATVFTGTTLAEHSFLLPASGDVQVVTNNKLVLKGETKNHRLHGNWSSFYPMAQPLDEGTLVKGVPDGEWKTWYAGGQLRSLRTYDADMYLKVKQDMELNHPKISRFYITERYKKEGSKIVYLLNAGYSFGLSTLRLPSTVEELVSANGAQTGVYHPPFQHMLHHGLYMNWFENGVVKDSGYYKEGLKEGVWLHRVNAHEGYWRGSYHNGLHVKEWKYYNTTGKLLFIIFYDEQGKELRRKDY